MNLPVKQYTDIDLARAHKKGKMIGWLQAGAVVVGGTILLNLMGWVLPIAAIGAVGWVGYKWMTRSSKDDGDDGTSVE